MEDLQKKEKEKKAYEVLETYKGKIWNTKNMSHFISVLRLRRKAEKKAFYVTCDTYVTLTDGTGVVHIAPAFGEDDAKSRT